jgi:hypothetical protein
MRPVSHRFPRTLALNSFAPEEASAIRALDVHVHGPTAGQLGFRYVLEADMDRLRIPPSRSARWADELWKHTCFEAFLAPSDGAGYYELNFSPSTEWAVYSFGAYRQGMTPLRASRPPQIDVQRSGRTLQVHAIVDLRPLEKLSAPTGLPPSNGNALPGTVLRLALAAVIENQNGSLSYWALKHAADRPDFHHPDSFIPEP